MHLTNQKEGKKEEKGTQSNWPNRKQIVRW